jgi:hypothetical protein
MQVLFFALLCCFGIVLCALLARTIILRWNLPWQDALMYFGLAPYPDEVPPRRRRAPR